MSWKRWVRRCVGCLVLKWRHDLNVGEVESGSSFLKMEKCCALLVT